ncbi:MAG: LamG-like jellyroll fold domain-containing protein, partial [Burkholderiales bacterium]
MLFPIRGVAQAGPVAAYGFDESTGTTASDASGNGFHGTLTNGPVWTTGQHGSALQFDASDDGNDDNDPRVVLGRAINIPDLPLTISAWVNPTDYTDWRAIISKRDSPVASDLRLDVGLEPGSGRVYVFNGAVNSFFYAPPVSIWTHLAVVADASGTQLYVNGALQETIGAITLGTSRSANAVIGGTGEGRGGDNDPFKGMIDDLRIYNRALNATEIQSDMNAAVVPVAPETLPPTAPTGLTATAVNGIQIDLAWTASTDNVWVAGYRVERCQGAGCTEFVQVGTSTATAFGNAGLRPLTAYSYRVRAVDPVGNLSAYSNVASATTSSLVPPGPVAAYGFDEGTGTTLADVSGNGFHGTLTNGPVWTTGQHGSALQFDASDDGNDDNDPRVVLGRTINILDLPLTISAWVHPTDYADWRAIVSKRDSPLASDLRLDIGLEPGFGRVYVFNGAVNSFFY